MTPSAPKSAADAHSAPSVGQAAHRVMRRCDELAGCSDRPGGITRLFCSPAMRSAHGLLKGWMEAAGLRCRLDPAGNWIGRLESSVSSPQNRAGGLAPVPALLIGSHLDSVVNAGRYDGPLGVLLGLAVAELAAAADAPLPFAIEVIGFCEEEGVRYQSPFFGSRALVGGVSPQWLERRDAEGVALGDALRSFGGDPQRLSECVYRPEQVLAFIEPHIEQGPTLESLGLPLGIVTGAVGQTRAGLRLVGRAGHAGTVPMLARRDALVAAAQWIVEVEQFAARDCGLVATVGQIEVLPNVANVIPGEVGLRLDLRHADDAHRTSAFGQLMGRAEAIARQRGLEFQLLWAEQHDCVQFDAARAGRLEQAVIEAGVKPTRLVSGAGHDAVILAGHFPTAMLFLRCAGGVSHHPDEAVSEGDVCLALDVLWRLVQNLAATQSNGSTAVSPA